MRLLSTFSAFTLILATVHVVCRGETTNVVSTALADAVKAFNAEASMDRVGKDQSPLTEDEVVAALRGWIRDKVPASDEIYDAYQTIAETRKLPEGSRLTRTTRWSGYNGYHFTVWWVDLNIRTGENTGYTYRIRDRKITSRPLRDDERQRLQRRRGRFRRF